MSHFESKSESAHEADLAITACFLSIPLVALLYAVLSFSVALAAFCIQNTETHGRVLLAVVIGLVGVAGFGTMLFFWHVWTGPREEEVGQEDVLKLLAYGWGSKASAFVNKTREAAGKGLERVRTSRFWKIRKDRTKPDTTPMVQRHTV